MFARFFIERPIFANVIAIVTMVIGGVSLSRLPVEMVPNITPPTVRVYAWYPGASAKVVADTVAAPIEIQVNGVEDMLYMSSSCGPDGSYILTVSFRIGTDMNMAQVLVQNRVAIAMRQLPADVQKQGIIVKKVMTYTAMFVCLNSPDGRYDALFLRNYVNTRIRDEIARLPGVGDVSTMPTTEYSMRVWLDPDKLQALQMTTDDVVNAINEQNTPVASGQIGQPPAAAGQKFQYTISVLGRLDHVAEFEDIVVKTSGDRQVRIKDVGRVELGGKNYDQYYLLNGKPAAGLSIYLLPGANVVEMSRAVRKRMEELKQSFLPGLQYMIPLDTTEFVDSAIHEVYVTLFEAGLLVLLVIVVFLGDFRAALVPATTVPVTIIGAFAAMDALGFTVNLLTMFGLVLAIGIVVDDAIVIVEGAAHFVEQGVPSKLAAAKAMDQLTGPVISITLVLMAVFLPTIFLGGITGQLYRQFALTIAATAVISAINAMTLKPAQCGQWLRKPPEKRNAFFRGFNYVYGKCEDAYFALIQRVVRFSVPAMLLYAGVIAFAGWLFASLPTGFLPPEDQGYVVMTVQLPDAASQPRTWKVVERLSAIAKDIPGVQNCTTIGGLSYIDGTILPNCAATWVRFKDWDLRKNPRESMEAIIANLRRETAKIPDCAVNFYIPPAIRGLGTTGGFQMMVEDREGVGARELSTVTHELLDKARQDANIAAVNTTYRANVPQIFLDVDRQKVKALQMPLSNVFGALQTYMGSTYVNDFNKFDRTYQVRVQADQQFRGDANELMELETRNSAGQMVPLGTVINVRKTVAPQQVIRYNLYPCAVVNGEAAPGRSSGQALQKMEELAGRTLPASMGYDWTAMSYQEKSVRGQAWLVFVLAVLLVYLVLAAQYENWTNPLAVILVVPLGLLGAAVAVYLRGMDNNVYTQVGIVLIIALASKNAILIVEYARELHEKGKSIVEAAAEASRRRFRPILMTSFAFILGVYPLVNAQGAGSASRRALGTAVFGGMIASTVLAVGFVPVFYVICQRFSEFVARRKNRIPRA
ncbi:MAG: multidrug efflux RND transporter permease subunit [Planctomycetota bacterium]